MDRERLLNIIRNMACDHDGDGLHYAELARAARISPTTALLYLRTICPEIGHYDRGRCYPDPQNCPRREVSASAEG